MNCWECQRDCVMRDKYKGEYCCNICEHAESAEIKDPCIECMTSGGECGFKEMEQDEQGER